MSQVTWAHVGDVIDVPLRDDLLAPIWIRPLCADVVGFGYWCESHATFLANVGNLVMHLEIDEPHHIAAYCRKHLGYEAPADEQMRLLAGVEA